jgi:hypothetical protein
MRLESEIRPSCSLRHLLVVFYSEFHYNGLDVILSAGTNPQEFGANVPPQGIAPAS